MRIRITLGHWSNYRFTLNGETSLSIFGHCEERLFDSRQVNVIPVRPLGITRRAPGSLHRVGTFGLEVIV